MRTYPRNVDMVTVVTYTMLSPVETHVPLYVIITEREHFPCTMTVELLVNKLANKITPYTLRNSSEIQLFYFADF